MTTVGISLQESRACVCCPQGSGQSIALKMQCFAGTFTRSIEECVGVDPGGKFDVLWFVYKPKGGGVEDDC